MVNDELKNIASAFFYVVNFLELLKSLQAIE